jgi:hypothetical protein
VSAVELKIHEVCAEPREDCPKFWKPLRFGNALVHLTRNTLVFLTRLDKPTTIAVSKLCMKHGGLTLKQHGH